MSLEIVGFDPRYSDAFARLNYQWIEHYFVQCMAYGCMLYELTGISVKKLVIIMTCENGEVQVYEEYDKMKYMKLLVQYIEKFVEEKITALQV